MYQVRARNFSHESENKIHSDEIAQKFGFTGALVPGVAVYGHLTYPLSERYGADWLAHSKTEVRLLKPAYHDDLLTVQMTEQPDGQLECTCHNESGQLLAVMKATLDPGNPTLEIPDAGFVSPERQLATWDHIVLEQPFEPWVWHADAATNREMTERVADPLPIYDEYLHPHWLQGVCNTVLTRQYVMPAWIHVGTEMRHHAHLKTGADILVEAGAAREVAQERARIRADGHSLQRGRCGDDRGDPHRHLPGRQLKSN